MKRSSFIITQVQRTKGLQTDLLVQPDGDITMTFICAHCRHFRGRHEHTLKTLCAVDGNTLQYLFYCAKGEFSTSPLWFRKLLWDEHWELCRIHSWHIAKRVFHPLEIFEREEDEIEYLFRNVKGY